MADQLGACKRLHLGTKFGRRQTECLAKAMVDVTPTSTDASEIAKGGITPPFV